MTENLSAPEPSPEPTPVRRPVDAPVASAAAAVRRAADAWGAEWEAEGAAGVAGRLRLPVTAGLRHGMMEGRLWVEALEDRDPGPEGPGPASRVSFQPERSVYYLNTTAVVLLAIAGFGGLLTLIWPFVPGHPEIARVAPLGAVLALAGWFLVVSRLETRGPEEFLVLVEMEALPEEGGEGG